MKKKRKQKFIVGRICDVLTTEIRLNKFWVLHTIIHVYKRFISNSSFYYHKWNVFFFFFIIFRSPTLCTNWAGNTCGLVDDSERSSAATQAGAVHPTRGKRRLNFYRHVSHEWNLTDLALDVRSSRAWSSLNVKYRLMLRCGDGGMRWARCSSVAPCEWEWQRWCDVMATIFNSPTIVPSCDTCKARINLPRLELTSTDLNCTWPHKNK